MYGNSDEPTGRLALVFELMEMNLYDAIKGIIEHCLYLILLKI